MTSVLITGGTGFLARGLTKALLDCGVERVCVYSRGEYDQAMMRQEFAEHGDRLRWFIGDVRDRDRLEFAMASCEHVIHAAALKRIEVGQYNPGEVAETNVRGTQNVIWAARFAGVKRVVFVSSDKAFEPVSPYGQTKALGETLCLAADNDHDFRGPRFAACRYGNIWRSTGSIVPTWEAMIARGAREVPVTNPECTRFFMRLEEAVKLVLTTLWTMKGGELAIPETLPAYRVGDLATAMGVAYRVTGMPGHEKIHESLRAGLCSETARRMTVDELREAL